MADANAKRSNVLQPMPKISCPESLKSSITNRSEVNERDNFRFKGTVTLLPT